MYQKKVSPHGSVGETVESVKESSLSFEKGAFPFSVSGTSDELRQKNLGGNGSAVAQTSTNHDILFRHSGERN